MARKCPGSKIRSQGQGRGLGTGKNRGPIGVPGGRNNGNGGMRSRRKLRRGIGRGNR